MRKAEVEAIFGAAEGTSLHVVTNVGVEGTFVRLETRRENYGVKWRYNTYVVLRRMETDPDGLFEEREVLIRYITWIGSHAAWEVERRASLHAAISAAYPRGTP